MADQPDTAESSTHKLIYNTMGLTIFLNVMLAQTSEIIFTIED